MSTKQMTVSTLEDLAGVLGVHRRTLADYAKKGCPTVKVKEQGYLVAPTIAWYGRMLMRRQIIAHLKVTHMPAVIEENLRQLLDDHEVSWPLYLKEQAK